MSVCAADAIISWGTKSAGSMQMTDLKPRNKAEHCYDVCCRNVHCKMMTRSCWEGLHCACNAGCRLRLVILGVLMLWARPCPVDLYHDAIYHVLS